MFLHFALTGLMLLSIPCRSCLFNWTVCKFFKEDPHMLKKNAEFLLKSGLKASNQVQIEDHLSVKSCLPTQYANIFECTAEASNFTIVEVCSFIGVFDFFCLGFIKACFPPLRFRRIHHLWISFHSIL